jgi:hypothetical protein
MGNDICPLLQDILFITGLVRRIMMDHIGDSVRISSVGDDTDVILEYNNITALPALYLINICGQGNGRPVKVNL